jgi:hypothetical protein
MPQEKANLHYAALAFITKHHGEHLAPDRRLLKMNGFRAVRLK